MSKEHEDQGFTVTDKRLFAEDGKVREDAAREDAAREGREPRESGKAQTAAPENAARGAAPEIDFTSYILSYYTQSLVLMGEVPNPYTNKKEEDLEAARHTVDILGMLKEKTKGNLTSEEQQLLDSVLYEARMKYMAKVNRIKMP